MTTRNPVFLILTMISLLSMASSLGD